MNSAWWVEQGAVLAKRLGASIALDGKTSSMKRLAIV